MASDLEGTTLVPIGCIHSPHQVLERTPIQPRFARGVPGRVEVFEPFEEGLSDLEGFSHLLLIYRLHRAGPPRLKVVPFMDHQPRGIFATRHPERPNHLGLSLVRLQGRSGRWLEVMDVDIVDGAPLLDIKPFYPAFDVPEGAVAGGWVDQVPEALRARRGRRA